MREAGSGTRLQHDQLAARVPVNPWCTLLVTLCRFDDKPWPEPLLGPFIPCERRLATMEISVFQGRDLWTGFWNRDYGRPHEHF